MIKYRAVKYGREMIRQVEVAGETAKMVEIADCTGRVFRHKKEGVYFDTFEEAKAHLMDVSIGKMDVATRRLWAEQDRYVDIFELEDPKQTEAAE